MKWKTWGSSDRSGLAGVFSEHLFYYWGQNIFPLAVFLGGGIILQLGLSQIADTCMRLRWPTTVKIESDGIWWLTHSSGPEREKKMGGEKSTSGRGKKKNRKRKYKDSHMLHVRLSASASAIRKTAWIRTKNNTRKAWNTFQMSDYDLNAHDWGKQTHARFLP